MAFAVSLFGILVTVSPSDAASATSTTLNASSNETVFGESVSLTASVDCAAMTPTGEVTFAEGSTTFAVVALGSEGTASVSLTDLSVGAHTVSASYAGDSACDASTSSPLALTVHKASTSTALEISNLPQFVVGMEVTITATVAPVSPGAGTPTGAVRVLANDTLIAAPPLESGRATTTLVLQSIGSLSIRAEYPGDDEFGPSSLGTSAEVIPVPEGCLVELNAFVCSSAVAPRTLTLPETGRTKQLSLRRTEPVAPALPNTGSDTVPLLITAFGLITVGLGCRARSTPVSFPHDSSAIDQSGRGRLP